MGRIDGRNIHRWGLQENTLGEGGPGVLNGTVNGHGDNKEKEKQTDSDVFMRKKPQNLVLY